MNWTKEIKERKDMLDKLDKLGAKLRAYDELPTCKNPEKRSKAWRLGSTAEANFEEAKKLTNYVEQDDIGCLFLDVIGLSDNLIEAAFETVSDVKK